MEWIANNWYLIVGALAIVVVAVFAIVKFAKLPTSAQIAKVKEWLKFAVTEAEKALKGGTGQLKLRMVYDMFVAKFPWVARMVSFDVFSTWVDGALVWLDTQLQCNEKIQDYVGK